MNNEQIIIPDIHIGNEIKTYLKARGISQANIARKMGRPTSNLTRILRRKSIETRLLIEISNAAEHNFFTLWCEDMVLSNVSLIPISEFAIGKKIKDSLNEIGLSQGEFATKLGIVQSDVSRILKKTSFDTDRLAHISRILGKNLFFQYCLNEEDRQYGLKTTGSSGSLLIDRLEKLIIENSQLKQELKEIRMENARLRCTV